MKFDSTGITILAPPATIKMITEEGTAVILVEQHAEVALSLTEHALLLERGAIVHRARSVDLLKDHAALDRYIGLRVMEG